MRARTSTRRSIRQLQDTVSPSAATACSPSAAAAFNLSSAVRACALAGVMRKFPDAAALSCGAVLSDYQRLRVENVCRRLKLTSLAPLWRVPQQQLVDRMLADGIDAVLVKVNRFRV